MEVSVTINGMQYRLEGGDERSLLTVLHNDLGLTGTGSHCLQGHCGACAVLVDRTLQRACVTPLSAVAGATVVTVEGLCAGDHPVCTAFAEAGLFDCRQCSSGHAVGAAALLLNDATLDEDALMAQLDDHICYCLRYDDIRCALRTAVTPPGADTTISR